MSSAAILKKIIEESENIVFFGGAGVSTGSGIPDFRSSQGLYSTDFSGVRPETVLSHDYLMNHPKSFYEYYKANMIYPDAKPNGAHLALAALEKRGKLKAVITQNIDGLHRLAGSDKVIELHGSVEENYCVDCGERFDLPYVLSRESVPRCSCGGFVRPDVVMYGEPLPTDAYYEAARYIYEADVLIVGGTSLTVNPAASLVSYYRGKHLIIINMSETPFDRYAEHIIREPIEDVFSELVDR